MCNQQQRHPSLQAAVADMRWRIMAKLPPVNHQDQLSGGSIPSDSSNLIRKFNFEIMVGGAVVLDCIKLQAVAPLMPPNRDYMTCQASVTYQLTVSWSRLLLCRPINFSQSTVKRVDEACWVSSLLSWMKPKLSYRHHNLLECHAGKALHGMYHQYHYHHRYSITR